eukprot:CAMPEP_0113628356 /NCGR_PEP_ID=MMETSP0017_2-20120614/14692_1 /TAXON_ID=2856 /ORGANISM="Cylindrotheca closterium" /LENGTH=443 /DNA_ID=CAMNT_0000538657 /DNA_START=161 /DNA_END=1492 /DNA_ORIENTATION=- /assembly_acc=CAM_ASM_000147
MHMSSMDDDELSRLIGKRSQIKRKKREEIDLEMPSEDDLLESLGGDPADLDLDKMPEFQTKREARVPKKPSEDEKKQDTPAEPEFNDYYVDYEDENDFHIPNRMGVTTRCWGDEKEGFVSSGKLKKQAIREGKFVPGDIQVAYNKLLTEGIFLFETSPDYGKVMASKKLSGEDIMARCIQEYQETESTPLIVGTYNNQLWQRGGKGLTDSLSKSCEKLEVSAVDVYQIKNTGWLPSGGLVKGVTEAVVDMGTAGYVGVKNMAPIRMRRIINKLDAQGITLTTNSFAFSLVNRKNEKWINACKLLGVTPLIENPLGSGLASGQYTASNPSGGVAGAAKYSFETLDKLQPLHSVLETVAEKVKRRVKKEMRDIKDRGRARYGPPPKVNTDITTTQIALNYIVAKGAVPLVEVNGPSQADEVLGCMGWSLNDDEVSMLEAASDLCK